MERMGILDSTNELDIFALHYVYAPRIERAIAEFVQQWNYHGLRTMNGKSPLALWNTGIIANPYELAALDDENGYGIDVEGPLPELQTDNNVQVPECLVQLTEDQNITLGSQVNPLDDDGNHGIEHFRMVVRFLNAL